MTISEITNKPKKKRGGSIDPNTGEIKEYPSQLAAKEDGFEPRKITDCVLGKKASHKNYYWEFLDDSSPTTDHTKLVKFSTIVSKDIDGNTIKYVGHQDFADAGLDADDIIDLCDQGRGEVFGLTWNYMTRQKQLMVAPKILA